MDALIGLVGGQAVERRADSALLLCGAAVAQAGECPKDKMSLFPREIESKDSVGVTRETPGLIDLKGWSGVGPLI